MGRLISGILLLAMAALMAISIEVTAAGIVNQWYEQEYEAVQQQQQVETQKKAATRCEKRIEKYKRKLRGSPNDRWYKWRLQYWTSRCEEDSSANPYIKK